MFSWEIALVGSALAPLLAAWWANRRSTLTHALAWATLAWLAWLWNAATRSVDAAYISLALIGCAGVAVLGARRPGAAAWNTVVVGLFAVLLVPLAQEYISGGSWLDGWIWAAFVGVTIAVVLLNYLPTRLGIGALALAGACCLQLAQLRRPDSDLWRAGIFLAGISPWLAGGMALLGKKAGECDRLWRQFRDRFGFLWGQRLREQFNSATRNAGQTFELGWTGLRKTDGSAISQFDQAQGRELLAALTQRFSMQ
jgi:hypothetical protein